MWQEVTEVMCLSECVVDAFVRFMRLYVRICKQEVNEVMSRTYLFSYI
jgi:hypothetical protein